MLELTRRHCYRHDATFVSLLLLHWSRRHVAEPPVDYNSTGEMARKSAGAKRQCRRGSKATVSRGCGVRELRCLLYAYRYA